MIKFIMRFIKAYKIALITEEADIFCLNGRDCESCKKYLEPNKLKIHRSKL